jgi:hypothetical protein
VLAMYSTVLTLLCSLSAVSAATLAPYSIFARDASAVCADLSVSSNNGNRKVAIVIDSSGSMVTSDPYDYRVAAGRALNSFLISNSEASSSQQADRKHFRIYFLFPLVCVGSRYCPIME